MLFSELLADKVEIKPHAARFFNYLAGVLELRMYRSPAMGTPPYTRVTLVAVILFAMYKGHFESRSIIHFAEDSIGAQWILCGMKMPSYKTVERTISALFQELDQVFAQVLVLCDELSLIGRERAYTDGTKIKANASKHKAMSYEYLIKKIGNGKEALEVLFAEFRDIIEGLEELPEEELREQVADDAKKAHLSLNKSHREALAARQEQVFGKAQPEIQPDPADHLNGLKITEHIDLGQQESALELLNDIAFTNKRVTRMEAAREELEKRWKAANGEQKIPDKQQINFTDPDSCIMTTKHQGVQQCYNHFAIADDKANIILGYYTSSNACDQLSLLPTIENTGKTFGRLGGYKLGADAGFFSAGNIAGAESRGIDYYASYPESKSPYGKDKFQYDETADAYTCPGGNCLSAQWQSGDGGKCRYYNEAACRACGNAKDCTKAKDGVRRIERDMADDKIREQAKEKAKSKEGREILKKRKSVIEPIWGNIKLQDGYTQMHYRGIEKAGLEFGLHCLIQNIRKLLKVYFSRITYQEAVHSQECAYQQTA